jgi:hypothetical protein
VIGRVRVRVRARARPPDEHSSPPTDPAHRPFVQTTKYFCRVRGPGGGDALMVVVVVVVVEGGHPGRRGVLHSTVMAVGDVAWI